MAAIVVTTSSPEITVKSREMLFADIATLITSEK